MTNAQFMIELENMCAKYPIIEKSNPKSVNELVYVLRMRGEEYCLNIIDSNGSCMCVPSVEETFIPSSVLTKKIDNIEYDEEIFEEYGKHLIIVEVKEM